MELTIEHSAQSDCSQEMPADYTLDLVRGFQRGCDELKDKLVNLLCSHYEINAHQVGDIYPDVASPSDHSKWFVSVMVGSGLEVFGFPPLAENEYEAKGLAFEHYNLIERYLSAH